MLVQECFIRNNWVNYLSLWFTIRTWYRLVSDMYLFSYSLWDFAWNYNYTVLIFLYLTFFYTPSFLLLTERDRETIETERCEEQCNMKSVGIDKKKLYKKIY
jgi:hypothetical protein